VSIFGTARSIYIAIKDDCAAIDAVRTARSQLALSLATDPSASNAVTSATMNGQSFSATVGMKPMDRLRCLSLVCQMADNAEVPSRMTQPYL
jgi:hypothetical protein